MRRYDPGVVVVREQVNLRLRQRRGEMREHRCRQQQVAELVALDDQHARGARTNAGDVTAGGLASVRSRQPRGIDGRFGNQSGWGKVRIRVAPGAASSSKARRSRPAFLGSPMTDHINRWLLAFAAAYLFLLPTNAATFAVSVAFAGATVCAVLVFILAWRDPATRIPLAGAGILVPLALWSAWSFASLAWSADPPYSRGQLSREVMDSLLAMFVFYVAARDARSLRVLIGAAPASFACLALLAIGMQVVSGSWDAGRWHHGVGAWSTWVVLIAPFMFALIAPPPAGFGGGARLLLPGLALLALMITTARMTDNRIVWIALAAVFATASAAAALRWPATMTRTPWRWVAPLAVLLLVLGFAFADVLEDRAQIFRQANVALSIERDPRIVLWERVIDKIG